LNYLWNMKYRSAKWALRTQNTFHVVGYSSEYSYTRVYPKVSGLATWSENCKWYSSLPLGAVVSQSNEFYLHNPLCCSQRVFIVLLLFISLWLSPDTPSYT
jgi:hypothetical protein